jgi:hypothetical protein
MCVCVCVCVCVYLNAPSQFLQISFIRVRICNKFNLRSVSHLIITLFVFNFKSPVCCVLWFYTPMSNLTFVMVLLHTGTNFPAVSVNSLLAAAMMKVRERWNGTGVPTQSEHHAASLIACAWNTQIIHMANMNFVIYVFSAVVFYTKIHCELFVQLVFNSPTRFDCKL